MSILRWIARRWIPAGVKAKTSYRTYLSFIESLLRKKNPDEDEHFREELMQFCEDVGRKLAAEVKTTFNLGNSIEDAVDAWKIGCVAGNVTYRVERKGDAYIFHHPTCEMHSYFTEKGIVPCQTICLPMVKAIAESICPDCEIEVIHAGDLETRCIKSMRPGGDR